MRWPMLTTIIRSHHNVNVLNILVHGLKCALMSQEKKKKSSTCAFAMKSLYTSIVPGRGHSAWSARRLKRHLQPLTSVDAFSPASEHISMT